MGEPGGIILFIITIMAAIIIGRIVGGIVSTLLTIAAVIVVVVAVIAFNAGAPLPDALNEGFVWLVYVWDSVKEWIVNHIYIGVR